MRSVWGKLYKRSIIVLNEIKFAPGLRFGEDALFNLGYLRVSKAILFVPYLVYGYDLSESSTVKVFNVNDGKYLEDFIIAAKSLLDTYDAGWDISPEMEDKFIAMEISSVWWRGAASEEKLKKVKSSFEKTFLNSDIQAVLYCNPSIGILRSFLCRVRFYLIKNKYLMFALVVDRLLERIYSCIITFLNGKKVNK